MAEFLGIAGLFECVLEGSIEIEGHALYIIPRCYTDESMIKQTTNFIWTVEVSCIFLLKINKNIILSLHKM